MKKENQPESKYSIVNIIGIGFNLRVEINRKNREVFSIADVTKLHNHKIYRFRDNDSKMIVGDHSDLSENEQQTVVEFTKSHYSDFKPTMNLD